MSEKKLISITQLLQNIKKEKDTYGNISVIKFKKNYGLRYMSFSKSPIIYLINTGHNKEVFSFSKN